MSLDSGDLRLPRPLLKPSEWPIGNRFSIFALTWGGPILERLNRLGEIAIFEKPAGFEARASELTQTVIAERLQNFKGVTVREESSSAPGPTLLDWARAVFIDTENQLGQFQFRRFLEKFSQSLQPEFATLDTLRLFPGYLKREESIDSSIKELAALELARVTVLFSPQEADQLVMTGRDEIAQNPTLEVIEIRDRLVAIYRDRNELREVELDWQEAATIDELRENPKTPRNALVQELEGIEFKLPVSRSFAETVNSLVERKILLSY